MRPFRVWNALQSAARLSPGRPAFAAGVRAGIATLVPLLVGLAMHNPLSTWAALGGFLTAQADKGGAYRVRAATTVWLTAAIVISTIVGALSGWSPWIAIPVMLLWATAASLIRVLGAGATSVGLSAAIVFAASLASPLPAGDEVVLRGLAVLLGGAWAIVLSLVLWPIRYYRPARTHIASIYRALGRHADTIVRYVQSSGAAAERQQLFQLGPALIRETIEQARTTLVMTRRGRSGESPRGERLLVLLEGADQTFSILIAITGLLDATWEDEGSDAQRMARAAAEHVLLDYARTAADIAVLIETEGAPSSVPSVAWSSAAIREGRQQAYLPVADLVDRLRQYTEIVIATAAALDAPKSVPVREQHAVEIAQPTFNTPMPWQLLREALTPESIAFRHALRVGLTAAVAVALTTAWHLTKGFWVTLTVLVILQPYTAATVFKGLQRVGGTVLGCTLAALISLIWREPPPLLMAVFLLSVVGVAVMPLNYGLYSACMACEFVLLSELGLGDWNLFKVRFLNTVIGGALAFLGARVLWPSSEKNVFPAQMAGALRAARDYLHDVVSICLNGTEHPSSAFSAAGRKVGVTLINAEALLQRFFIESGTATPRDEAAMALLLYTRRFNVAVIALRSISWTEAPEAWRAALTAVEHRAVDVLSDIAMSLEHRMAPEPLPDFVALLHGLVPSESPSQLPSLSETGMEIGSVADAAPGAAYRARVERIARQLRVLHTAATRFATLPASAMTVTSEISLSAPA